MSVAVAAFSLFPIAADPTAPVGAFSVPSVDQHQIPVVAHSAGLFGDQDGDNDVDLDDYRVFRRCLDLSGPDISTSPACNFFNVDGDSDIDMIDTSAFMAAFTGPFSGPVNDDCVDAIAVNDGDTHFSTVGATTDGPDEPTVCVFEFGTSQVLDDIWFCYEATCSGTVVASLCGSTYDTKLAAYDGCDCPPAQAAIVCSDDDCSFNELDSRVEFEAAEGQSYMIRIGAFDTGIQGNGFLALRCDDQPLCEVAEGDCFDGDANTTPGCDDPDCCATVCAVDPFCCDVTWDTFCADEAQGLCTGGFEVCSTSTGDCGSDNGTIGCEDEGCCNSICAFDPFCCVSGWDSACADEAAGICGINCGTKQFPQNNACTDVAVSGVDFPLPGCGDEVICQEVCNGSPECCLDEAVGWDQRCVCLANPVDDCCVAVCAVDAFCCSPTGAWDDLCDEQAAELCP